MVFRKTQINLKYFIIQNNELKSFNLQPFKIHCLNYISKSVNIIPFHIQNLEDPQEINIDNLKIN